MTAPSRSPQNLHKPISLTQRRAHERLFQWLFSPLDSGQSEESDLQPQRKPTPIRTTPDEHDEDKRPRSA